MPRVAIKKKEYKVNDLSKWIVGEMREKKLRQKDIAKILGISQPAVSYRIEKGLFTYRELLTLFEKFETTDKDILHLMKL